jgi:hypothetical protein|tara:strand:+ start:315 stop:701 length:387 start_codon:yes stop_codon:yes gene_type:complete
MAREFKVIVAGSRTARFDASTYQLLERKLNLILEKKSITHDIVIISGGAAGADFWGELYARDYNYKVKRYPANWDTHGKRAGYLRNEAMAANADALVALWDGTSRGTQHMINIAAQRGLPTRIIRFGE